ncbi:MAG: hypothetical protein ACKOT0_10020 [bacterium]
MAGLRGFRLSISMWPFFLVAPGELLFYSVYRMNRFPETPASQTVATTALLIALSLLAEWLCLIAWSATVGRRRWARGTAGAVAAYSVAVVVGSCVQILGPVPFRGSLGVPTSYLVLFPLSRVTAVLVLAVVADQARDAVRTWRELNRVVAAQLTWTQRVNDLLERARRRVAAESMDRLRTEVVRPLRSIMRKADQLDDEELARELDSFVNDRLRRLAHRLHPVSVRAGLIPALRSLDPDITIDATRAIERLDSDGTLLDEDVRLQLYRWIRQAVEDGRSTRVALVMRARTLEVSVHPATVAPLLDPVQIVAGLRSPARGLVSAPLRGQSTALDDVVGRVSPDTARVRGSFRPLHRLLTVPLPGAVGAVTLLAISGFFTQLVLWSAPASIPALITGIAWSLTPILVAYVLTLLPAPRRTVAGAWRVVLQWVLVGISAAVAFRVCTLLLGDAYTVLDATGLAITRALYRFTLPLLALVIAHGLRVSAHASLEEANAALLEESERQQEILDESQELDRDVAEVLHRDVQGRLSASIVLIRLGERQRAWQQVVDLAERQIPSLRARLRRASGTPDLLIPEPPEGLIVVEQFALSDIPVDLLEDVRRSASEIAVNAVRHGGATRLVVSRANADRGSNAGRITLVFDDNGRGLAGGGSPGLGSRLLDDVAERWSGSWRMESQGTGCRVVLELDAHALATRVAGEPRETSRLAGSTSSARS